MHAGSIATSVPRNAAASKEDPSTTPILPANPSTRPLLLRVKWLVRGAALMDPIDRRETRRFHRHWGGGRAIRRVHVQAFAGDVRVVVVVVAAAIAGGRSHVPAVIDGSFGI